MIKEGIVRSTCDMCSAGCGVLVHVADGKPVRIEGDPDSPVNTGSVCAKGLASLEYFHHPDRLRRPLKRVGERGGGEWQQISWDEALSVIAEALTEAKDNYGVESIAFIRGANKGLRDDYATRFANAFGTPNILSTAYVCFMPRRIASVVTCGFDPFPDYEYPPACIVNWGANMHETNVAVHERMIRALNKGANLIVVDPRKTELAKKADVWVQLRPGSDLALALAMINVIVNEGLFDRKFVDNWTVGFEELMAHVSHYPPDKVQETTWVSAGIIQEAARLYAANKPACMQLGNALDHNVNSFQTARAISILRAITGNLEIPGAEVQWSLSGLPNASTPEMSLQDQITMDERKRRLGADCVMPTVFYALPQAVTKAITDADPYPVRVAYVQGCNPLLTWSNARETYEALKQLDFLAVADMFLTPTAALADIVLPVATSFEFNSIITSPYCPVAQVQQKVSEVAECWSDMKILNELAKKLGLGQYFWKDEEQFLDAILKPVGLTFEEFSHVGVVYATKQYRTYETRGFETPSRKVELYSNKLKEWGFDPLPMYRELPETPYSSPEMAREYPLILTNWKSVYYRHAGGRQITSLRGARPDPVVNMHEETARELGIQEGDWVYIETKRGRIRQKAALTNSIDPRVVIPHYGWWFPEKAASNSYGWDESNINILTDNKPPYNREMGSVNLRGILCRVYKVS